jgi:uncharacterized protein Yka (UPF0111/DUF47 family)
MSIQSVVRWLLPKEDQFFGFLENQAAVAHKGATALALLAEGRPVGEVSAAVQDLEHEGDKIVQEMVNALARTFVTPIDREDLHRLSSELDNILDLTNDAARTWLLFGGGRPTEAMARLFDVLVRSTAELDRAVPKLRLHRYGEIIEIGGAVRGLEKEGDSVFRGALGELFGSASLEIKGLLREKEMLENLERAIDHCEQVANTLTNLAVKHG